MLHFKNPCTAWKQATTNIGIDPILLVCFESIVSRLILRCRQLARERFAKMRADVLVKLELLDQKHGRSLFKRLLLSFISRF